MTELTKKVTREQRIKRIEDSKAEKRVVIVKDALKQLEEGKYTAQRGSYFFTDLDMYDFARDYGVKIDDSAQPFMDEIQEGCEVCVMGSLLLSHIRLNNKVSIKQLHNVSSDGIIHDLRNSFTKTQLKLMEAAFEGYSGFSEAGYNTDKECLIAILKNVIKNKGTFKP